MTSAFTTNGHGIPSAFNAAQYLIYRFIALSVANPRLGTSWTWALDLARKNLCHVSLLYYRVLHGFTQMDTNIGTWWLVDSNILIRLCVVQ